MEEELRINLENLGFAIQKIIHNLSLEKILKNSYVSYITNEFDYNQSVSWNKHIIEKVDINFLNFETSLELKKSNELKEVKKSVEHFIHQYKDESNIVKTAVKNNLNNVSSLSDSFLEGYIKKVNEIILECSDNDLKLINSKKLDEKINELVNSSVHELKGYPLKCQLTLKLTGLIIKPKKISINDDVELFKPVKKDCNLEFIDSPFFITKPFCPSAILIFKSHEFLNGQLNIEYYIKYFLAFFRLFKKGEINCIGYNFKSEAILNEKFNRIPHFSTNINKSHELSINPLNGYELEKISIVPLKNFIAHIEIHKLFSDDITHLKISYEHFCNALSSNYNFEKQIVDTIMGFEALFMKKGDKEGGSYKIRMIIARLFDSLLLCEPKNIQNTLIENYGPENVSQRINDGFRVRNKYAHGERISKSMHKEFMDKYNGIDNLLNYLIDYLRISIILMTINDKEDFLDLISASLIRNECNDELKKSFADVKQFNLLNNIELEDE